MLKYTLEYIWLDGNYKLRSKTKIESFDELKDDLIENIPIWNFDGSSTGQASGDNSEIIIKPCAIYKDPFRDISNAYLVLCDTYTSVSTEDSFEKLVPHETNNRIKALQIFDKYENEEPIYGIEQEFFIANKKNGPLFTEFLSNCESQGNYYCGIGSENIIGRKFMEEVLQKCLFTELNITGMNAEVAPGQWEFQVCAKGIHVCDELYILRYILQRVAEKYDWTINYHPKPVSGDWNGSGCHVNFSTKNMRMENGIEYINSAIEKLSKKHAEHMELYGSNNDLRMTGLHETADYNNFSYGVANRGCSIRIPKSTFFNKKGYFEDRRPAANMDPYIVTSKLLNTILE